MHNIFLSFFCILFSFSLSAQVHVEPECWFRRIPENEALHSLGVPYLAELKSSGIKTLIWNVKKGQMSSWRSEFLKFSKEKDLFLIQEAYLNSSFQSALSTLPGFHWTMGISFLFCRDHNTPTGTMVGSSVIPLKRFVEHSPDLEIRMATPKAITFVTYGLENKPEELLVISVHGINFQTTEALNRQMDEVARIIRQHEGPVLLAGDFNTWNQSRTSSLFKLTRAIGLKPVRFRNAEQRMKFGKFYLDHAFERGLVIKDDEVVSTDGSDHTPMMIEADIL